MDFKRTWKEDDLQFGDKKGVEIAEWLEKILKVYFMDQANREIEATGRQGNNGTIYSKASKSKTTPPIFNGLPSFSSILDTKESLFLFITNLNLYEVQNGCPDETWDHVFAAKTTFYLGNRSNRQTEDLAIKICHMNMLESPSAPAPKLNIREIDFYTKIIPTLEDWALRFGIRLSLGLQTCFFGAYEESRSGFLATLKRFLPTLTFPAEDTQKNATDFFGMPKEISTAKAMLILQDLDDTIFRTTGLKRFNIEEVKSVLWHLANIHATSWAYQREVHKRKDLTNVWPFLLTKEEIMAECAPIVKNGIFALAGCLRRVPERKNLVGELENAGSRVVPILAELLSPPEAPEPTTLLHFDLRPHNIYFSTMDGGKLPENHALKYDEIDCRITGWKLITTGSPMRDVAQLFLTSLTTEDRRKHSRKLLSFYYQAFTSMASVLDRELKYDVELFEYEYQRGLCLAFMLLIGNLADGEQDIPANVLKGFVDALEDVSDTGFLDENHMEELQKLTWDTPHANVEDSSEEADDDENDCGDQTRTE